MNGAANQQQSVSVAVRGLRKSYDGAEVLHGVSLEVARGEIFVIMGPSGSGKSVLLKHIIGLIHPDSGQIIVDDQDVATLNRKQLTALRMQIGYVFQNGALFDSMNVFENIRLGLTDESQYKDSAYAEERVETCLKLVNLQASVVLKKFPAELSGGMRKRVGIARAIAGKPKYLLYDEPTSGLDPVNADIIDSLVKRLGSEIGVTSVMVTHDVRGAFNVADRLALLSEGRVVLQGTQEEFLASTNEKVRAFLERDFDPNRPAAA
jgi:phospholipid/cholesterol/gamma-HCH transport system ATP-binding protein